MHPSFTHSHVASIANSLFHASAQQGRIDFELYNDVVPKTTKNFAELCKGYNDNGKTLTYKNSTFHRVIPQFMLQGGDFTRHNVSYLLFLPASNYCRMVLAYLKCV